MTDSPTTPPTPDSLSSPATNPPKPGLRVKLPTRSRSDNPILSPTTETVDAGVVPDPVDLGDPGTRSSDDKPVPIRAGKSAFAEIARSLVGAAGMVLNSSRITTEAEQDQDVWIATDKDTRDIGDPVAAVVTRKTGMGAVESEDMADLISAGIAILGYIARNVRKAIGIRRANRQGRGLEPAERPSQDAPSGPWSNE